MGIEPTGKHVEIRGFDLFELEDGQLVSNTAYFDAHRLRAPDRHAARRTARAPTAR